ncbi:hypothetical protein [Paenibacillus lignilyticus]|uniref:pirin family protein n=1 Tax=Paenibacillus lignilyticus TaxID=1172615 RepID=UPI001F0ADC7B|nr:hypothetical protein [Paenibacillus lignilyticus]
MKLTRSQGGCCRSHPAKQWRTQSLNYTKDMTVYLSKLKQGSTITFEQEKGRRVFLFVIEGRLNLSNEIEDGAVLYKRDSARIVNETKLKLEGEHEATETFFMLIDLP